MTLLAVPAPQQVADNDVTSAGQTNRWWPVSPSTLNITQLQMTTTDAAFLTFPKVASCSQLQHHQFLLSFRTGVWPGSRGQQAAL